MAISNDNKPKDDQDQSQQSSIISDEERSNAMFKALFSGALQIQRSEEQSEKVEADSPQNDQEYGQRRSRTENLFAFQNVKEVFSAHKTLSPELMNSFNAYLKSRMNESVQKNDKEIKFPIDELAKLDDMINQPRWIIPVLPRAELETLLIAATDLAKQGLDIDYEPCTRFYRDGLTISFKKILCDEAVTNWKPEIHKCIFRNCKLLIELCALKILSDDCIVILELLAIVFNPNNKFHSYIANQTFPGDFLVNESNDDHNDGDENEDGDNEITRSKGDHHREPVYAVLKAFDSPRLWLVELIEEFGLHDGFDKIKVQFSNCMKSGSLNVALVSALIRPFGLCHKFLTQQTVDTYFKQMIEEVPNFLDNLSDNELKKESKSENKNDQITNIIKGLKNLATRLDEPKPHLEHLEILRLKNILKLLKISSFNGKMNALNEINKVIDGVDRYANTIPAVHHHFMNNSQEQEEQCLNSKLVAEWIKENQVLQIVLKDSLHQPQYVEKLEKIIRFIIKEQQLTLQDLDDLWAAQCGKHEAIVKNMHDLLAKLAWDFDFEQLDHLFECFQNSWTTASKKQREKLLELIRTLAEDDKEGVMAHKVLNLLWSLAHSNDLPTEIMDQALAAHIKILDYSCCQDRDTQKSEWLNRCILELTRENSDPNWVIPALKQIREICCLYFVSSNGQSMNVHQRTENMISRVDVIVKLQNEHNPVEIISQNLQAFMEDARKEWKNNQNLDPNRIYGSNRYSHVQEIKERLSFLHFLLKEGRLCLCEPQAIQIWNCLVQNSVFKEDREEAFNWFSQLMTDEQDLNPDVNRSFFENQILKLDPVLLTESGIVCFDKFFKVVNFKEDNFIYQSNNYYTKNLDLIGLDYLTRIVLNGVEEVADLAIELLKAIYSNLGDCLQRNKLTIIEEFILTCMDRLKSFYDIIQVLEDNSNQSEEFIREKQQEMSKMTRFLKLLYEYLNQCDVNYGDERIYLPMLRSFRGKNTTILIRLQSQNRNIEDVMIETHSNETLLNIKKQYLSNLKMPNVQVDFFMNGEQLDQEINRDKKLVSHLTTKDHFILTARISKSNFNSINDSDLFPSQKNFSHLNDCYGSQSRFENGCNEDAENCLPSVYMSNHPPLYKSLFDFADLGLKLKYKPIYLNSLEILKLMPIDKSKSGLLNALCKSDTNSQEASQLKEQLFSSDSPTKLCYTLGVIYSLLMPANNPLSDDALEFQVNFIKSGIALDVQKFITTKDFLHKADDFTKVCAYSIVLKISKFVLKTIANYLVQSGVKKQIEMFKNLPRCLDYLQNSNEDVIICQAAKRTGNVLIALKKQQKLNQFQVNDFIPDFEIINFVVHFIWSTASGREAIPTEQSTDSLHEAILNSSSDSESTIYNICKQGLEVLTIMFMLSPAVFLKLIELKKWESFTMDLILFSPEKSVRIVACEQFAIISTMCSTENDALKYYINFLNQHLESTIPKNHKNSSEFFQLYCKLLNNAYINKVNLSKIKKYLHFEIDLLKNVKERLLVDGQIEEIQLEGHLCIIKELVMMLSPEEKYQIGCKLMNDDSCSIDDDQYDGLLVMLVDEYIFTASKVMVAQQKLSQRNILSSAMQCDNNSSSNSPYNSLSCIYSGDVDAICQNSSTLEPAFDLITALCIGCVPNLKYICNSLIEMFYSDHEICLTEWEYQPSINCRSHGSFVGLKNGGATCYMNSVLQQLYMIPEIRDGLLSVEGAIDDNQVEFYDDDKAMHLPVNYLNSNNNNNNDQLDDKNRKDYNVGVVKHIQAIFGHLTLNKLQYYIPKGFWRHFRLWGEPINLREQHDALEFFNSLVDSIDEGLKKLNYNKLMASVLGGTFEDQKICKGCPHSFSREEPFTTLNIDIRNHSNLLESLEQYVKGDLLEGANAYHCEKCNRKVDTVKRLCIKKLPTILTIQLKRFDYDWEKGCSIKFNDYFEFPRMLDMEPYTVEGLAKIEGKRIEDMIERENISLEIEINEDIECKDSSGQEKEIQCTKYELCGIVVHSGQASGGHYYSYILHKDTDSVKKWCKFDDGDVSECKLDQDEEMKTQCFGGDYLGEVFDHMLKRVSCRKQKRWWSAYILFYRRADTEQCQFSLRLNELVLSNANINSNNLMRTSSNSALIKQNSGDSEKQRKIVDTNVNELYLRIPTPIRRSVQRENIKFMHMRNQFIPEYFNFIKSLTSSNHNQLFNQLSNFSSNEINREEHSLRENYSNTSSPTTTATALSKESAQQQIEISFFCTKLLAKFLFTTCFHIKKNLRGSAIEWYEILTIHLRTSPKIRGWFAHNILIDHPGRFSEYLLSCISADIRNVFAKLVIFIAHFALLDGNRQAEIELDDGTEGIIQCGQPLSDYIMQLVLDLLKRNVNDRHLNHMNQYFNQYFNLFYQYCETSREARTQLIKLNVPARFMNAALDDNVIPSLKSQYSEFGRLHQVVSTLVRSCDISFLCKSGSNESILSNPYGFENGNYICNLPQEAVETLFNKQLYAKKLFEEAANFEETFLFLKYCCWENPRFSFLVLEELLWHVAFSYDNDLKPHLDLLLDVLLMQDSWQRIRIHNALTGPSPSEKEGVLDIINRNKSHHQKRAYLCIKFLVNLFTNCEIATIILQTDHDIQNKYITVVGWLNEELNRSLNNNQSHYNWNSNEGNNTYRLFRSNSARITLSKAINLCPKEEVYSLCKETENESPNNSTTQDNEEVANTIEIDQIEQVAKKTPNAIENIIDNILVENLVNKAVICEEKSQINEESDAQEEVTHDQTSPPAAADSQKNSYKLSEI